MKSREFEILDKYCNNVIELCELYKYLLKEHTFTPSEKITLQIMFTRHLQKLVDNFEADYYLN